MILDFSYTKDFENFFDKLKKIPEAKELMSLDGIGEQCDLASFSRQFFSKNGTTATADVSVDSNSNVDDMSIISYEIESAKPLHKQNSYYLLFKYGKKLFGEKEAEKMLYAQFVKDIYINDFYKFNSPYCFNFSCMDVMINGLSFVKKIVSTPPNNVISFNGQLQQFINYASNSIAGAVGLADFLITYSYYVGKLLKDERWKDSNEDLKWWIVKQELQSTIFTVNQPFRGGVQSPFTNISVYDDNFLTKMCDEYIFPDGSHPDKELIKKLQLLYLNIMNETLRVTPCTFPVTTACLSVDSERNILDKDFLKLVCEENKEFGFINFFAGETSVLSSCCFLGSQETLTKSSNGINYMSFEDLFNANSHDCKRNFTIFHNGSWVKGKTIKVPIGDKTLYKITTINNKVLYVTNDHINATLEGDKETSKLTTNDYLLFNSIPVDSFPEVNRNLTYEQGVFIGAYLGDGSKSDSKNEIQLSLNSSKYLKLLPMIEKALKDWGIDVKIHLNTVTSELYPVRIYSEDVVNIINEWVSGKYAQEKELNLDCVLQSLQFRRGIVDGMYFTDGGNSNRIYSTSAKLIHQLEVVLTSIGIPSIVDISDRTDEPVIIKGETFERHFPLLCIRWYDRKNKRSMKDVYIVKNNSMFFRIKEISEVDSNQDYVYCFEMKNEDEPYFTLPNGVITHNCRLRSDTKKEYFNQFGAGGTKIGSLGVVTINLPRLAIKYKGDNEGFFNRLAELVELSAKINQVKRFIIKRRADNGNLPLYSLGFMDLNRQYSTAGITGVNEAVDFLGYDILEDAGEEIADRIITTINVKNDEMEALFGTPHNCEQVPAENSAIKLAQADKLFGYQDGYEFYSNQFIPLINNADLLDRIRLQGRFDSKMSGGAILHQNVEQRIEDVNSMMDLIIFAVKQGVIYQAINYTLQRCEDGHMSVGKGTKCPVCGKKITDEFTRVVGFLVRISNFHKVRREHDYPKRKWYSDVNI